MVSKETVTEKIKLVVSFMWRSDGFIIYKEHDYDHVTGDLL